MEEDAAAPDTRTHRTRRAISLADIPFEETRSPEPPGLPLAALLEGGDARQGWLRHWVRDPVQGALYFCAQHGLRLLPSGACSRFGAVLAPLARRYHAKRIFAQRIEHNLQALRPDLAADPAAAERALAGWWSNVCRTYAEFSVLDRLWGEGRIEIVGLHNMEEPLGSGRKVVWVSVHLGAWEASGIALHTGVGLPIVSIYQPEPNRFVNRIVYRMRKRTGLMVFPPGRRTAYKYYQLATGGGGITGMFVDEVRDSQIHFPLFGRPAPTAGNIVNVIKLARAADALLVPVYLLRLSTSRFQMTILPPMELLETGKAEADIAANTRRLDDIFTPLVLENIEQWYMLAELRLPPTL